MLYDRRIIQLAQHMRRSILAEFGDRILLSDPDLIERLFSYVPRSRSDNLRKLAEELRGAIEALPSAVRPDMAVLNYRGAAGSQVETSSVRRTVVSSPKRIYRGHVVE